MSWAALGPDDWVTNNDVLDGITTGILSLKSGQSVSGNNNFITKGEANAKLNITTIVGGATDWPTKDQLNPVGTIYYLLTSGYAVSLIIDTSIGLGASELGGVPLYTTNSSGIINVGDIVYEESEYGYFPLKRYMFIAYDISGVRAVIELDKNTGAVLSITTVYPDISSVDIRTIEVVNAEIMNSSSDSFYMYASWLGQSIWSNPVASVIKIDDYPNGSYPSTHELAFVQNKSTSNYSILTSINLARIFSLNSTLNEASFYLQFQKTLGSTETLSLSTKSPNGNYALGTTPSRYKTIILFRVVKSWINQYDFYYAIIYQFTDQPP